MKKRIPIAAGLAAALVFCYFAINAVNQQVVDQHLQSHLCGGNMGQGRHRQGNERPGSTLEITREYRAYVEDFMKKHTVKSVVDAGCGDWSFSSTIDWGDASYLGVDIAFGCHRGRPQEAREKQNQVQVGDITEELPAADLLISKDVLQHLSNKLIHKFIRNNLRKGKYKWVILTNDRSSENRDVASGGYRAIDLAAPPFKVRGLIDLPIKFGDETSKITSLLDLTQQP